ncbi:Multidrug resistance protein MdtH [Neomoorella glycerini]|uniref:Multidrug resistance protein MdtH n=1 Tax=Neomoorella glycerini TaxID=55779 RepID=A0A6I5ZV07_9FIRM|nr:Multidrug resistance protein MdtH [Moorella glycerini]
MFNVLITGLTSLLTDISTEMVYPLLPLYLTTALGASPAIVGVIEGLAESLASLLKVFSGAISDRLGRRKPLAIGGYGISALGKVFLVLATSWGWVLAGRLADRFGKGVRTAPRDAIIAEAAAVGQRGAAFGLHRLMDTLGASLGVVLAYYFLTGYRGDYRAVFLYSLIPAVLGVAVLFLVRERGSAGLQAKKISFNWRVLDPRLRSLLVVVFLFTLGNSSNQFLLLRAENLGFAPETVILLYLVYNLVYSLVSYPAGRLSDRIGRRTLLVLGYLAYGLVYLSFAVAKNPSAMWWLFPIYGLYIGFTEGVEKALVADIAPPEQKATLIGLHATIVGIGLLPASTLAGFLWDTFGPQAPFYFGGVAGMLASLGMWWILRPGITDYQHN